MLAHDTCAPVRRTVYSLNFLLTLVTALTTYFTTSLLIERGVLEVHVGLVFALGALANLLFLFLAPKFFSYIGNYKASILLLSVAAVSFALVAFFPNVIVVVCLVILYSSLIYTTFFLLDMVLEGSMPEEGITGTTRSFFITVSEMAWFLGPTIGGFLISFGDFELLYLVAAAISVPAIVIASKKLKTIRHRTYHLPKMATMANILLRDASIRGVFIAQFLLRVFYTTMVVYTPLYLVEHIGISYASFGALLSIAMIAYLIFDIPVGMLADRLWGEKELMALGFVIIAISTAALSFGTGTTILLWGGILFCTRIGAAVLDVTTESYFFKHVDGQDADSVGVFRMLGPFAYLTGPLLGSVILLVLPLQYLFVAFGVILLIGVPIALSLVDTK